MKPARFDYVRATDTAHALAALTQTGEDGRILAGGQSLMAILNMRLANPRVLIDVSATRELDFMRVAAGELSIGAATTQARLEWRPQLTDEVPLLAQAIPSISHFQIRNRGTVCGSVAHADPSAELPLVLVALNGTVTLRSERASRRLAAVDFFQGMLTTARADDEIVEAVHYPLRKPGERYAFAEFSARHGDYALVSCAAVVSGTEIRLTVGGVADRPTQIRWPALTGSALDDALNDFAWQLEAEDDVDVSAAYRRHLVRQLGRQVIESAT